MRHVLAYSLALPTLLLLACGDSSDASGAGGAAGTLDGPDVMLTAVTEDVYTAGALDGDDWETFAALGPLRSTARAISTSWTRRPTGSWSWRRTGALCARWVAREKGR